MITGRNFFMQQIFQLRFRKILRIEEETRAREKKYSDSLYKITYLEYKKYNSLGLKENG